MPDIVTFDPYGLRIVEITTGGDNELDWFEIYSEWKVWVLGDPQRQGFPPAFRVVGGDPISDVQDLGSTLFLLFPWKFRPAEHSHRLTMRGNIYTDPAGDSPVVPTLGTYTVLVENAVSNLVDASVARLDLAKLLDGIYVDTVNGNDAGDGTNTDPVQSVARVFELAATNKLTTVRFKGTFTLDRDAPGWAFVGQSELVSVFDPAGFDTTHTHFDKCTLQGTFNGPIAAQSCQIDLVYAFAGVFRDCGVSAHIHTAISGTSVYSNCFSVVPGTGTPHVHVGSNSNINFRNWSGGITLSEVTAGSTLSVDLDPGRCILDATCTGGTVLVRGLSQITNNSTGTTVVDAGLLKSELANQAAVAAALAAAAG